MANENGYYNNFDPNDNYYEVRAIAGRVEQSREDNELQAIAKHISKGIADNLWKNGQKLRGGELAPDIANPKSITVKSAEVYYNGVVHTVPSSTVTIAGVGNETIGVLFTEEVVTYITDERLKDPALGEDNVGQPGANRLKITKQWTVNNPNAVVVYNFIDGKLARLPDDGIDAVNQTLARRTYDESGNYTVNGFDVSVETKDSDSFYAVVGNNSVTGSSSKAYVQGREIVKLIPERISIQKANDPRLYELDQVIYTGVAQSLVINGTTVNSSDLLRVAEDRVRDFTEVFAEFRVENKAVTHGGTDSVDSFINSGESLREIYAVKNTSGGATAYSAGTDYLKTGNTINWAPVGAEPASGATYYVDYRYKRKLNPSEYSLVVDEATGASYLDLTNCNPKPEANYGVDVSYNYYLSRIDVLYVKPDGVIEVARGESERNASAKPVPPGMLGLCEIAIPAGRGAESAVVTQYNTRRFTMEDFHRILTRLERAEYNQAVKDLDSSAIQYAGSSSTTLSGILTEGFVYTADDIIYDGVNGISRIKFDKALTNNRIIDVPAQELVLPEIQSTTLLTILEGDTTARKFANTVTMATLSETNALVSQLVASSALKINPYGTSQSSPTIFITPSVDSETESDAVITSNSNVLLTPLVQTREQFPSTTQTAAKDNNLRQFTNSIKTYIKSGKVVHVRGFGYPADAIVQASFDNQTVVLTPVTSTVGLPAGMTLPAGAATIAGVDGKVQCNSNGEFLAKFNVPVGVTTGIKGVVVSDAQGNSGSAAFDGRGLQKAALAPTLKRVSEVVAAPVPKIVTFNAPSNMVGGSGTVTFTGSLTGLATKGIVRLGTGVLEEFTISPTSTNFSFTTTATVATATHYEVFLIGPSGRSEVKAGVIQFGGLDPIGTAPVVDIFSVPTDSSNIGYSTATVAWKFSGQVEKVTLNFSNDSYTNRSTHVLTNLPTSGTLKLDVFESGTVTISASGPGGIVSKTAQVNVRRFVAKSALVKRDPIGQTFFLKEGTLATEVEVFFKAKSATVPVTLEIRNVVNGYPGAEILASKQLSPLVDTIAVSTDGSAATRFIFANPVWLDTDGSTGTKEYAIVLQTDSPDYDVFVAKIGENTLGATPKLIQSQAYLDGVLFSSSNNLTWSPIQDSDLKFALKTATFNQTTTNILAFQSIITSNCTGMFVKTDIANQDAQNIVAFQYKLNNTGAWVSMAPGTYVDFDVPASQIDIRALLSGSTTTSPVVDFSTVTAKLLFRQSSGEYISKRATFAQAYNKVRMVTRSLVPAQGTVKVYFTDETPGAGPGGFQWTEVTNFGASVLLPDGKYIEKDNKPGTTLGTNSNRKFFRFRVRLETTDITVTPRVRNVMGIVNA
jgi:hypothetical protein